VHRILRLRHCTGLSSAPFKRGTSNVSPGEAYHMRSKSGSIPACFPVTGDGDAVVLLVVRPWARASRLIPFSVIVDGRKCQRSLSSISKRDENQETGRGLWSIDRILRRNFQTGVTTFIVRGLIGRVDTWQFLALRSFVGLSGELVLGDSPVL
jgi:hypothetical protein